MNSPRLRFCLPAAVAILLLSTATPALADPVRLVSGSIQYSRQNQAEYRVTADNGMQIVSEFGNEAGESWNPDHACFGCTPGTTIDLSQSESFVNGSGDPDVGAAGSIIIDGIDYFIDSLSFTIDADRFVLPDTSGDRSFTSAGQFLFRGLITGTSDAGRSVTFNLAGSGRTAAFFANNDWFSTTYSFAAAPAAVPEPGTLLLFATGATAAMARRRKQKQQAT